MVHTCVTLIAYNLCNDQWLLLIFGTQVKKTATVCSSNNYCQILLTFWAIWCQIFDNFFLGHTVQDVSSLYHWHVSIRLKYKLFLMLDINFELRVDSRGEEQQVEPGIWKSRIVAICCHFQQNRSSCIFYPCTIWILTFDLYLCYNNVSHLEKKPSYIFGILEPKRMIWHTLKQHSRTFNCRPSYNPMGSFQAPYLTILNYGTSCQRGISVVLCQNMSKNQNSQTKLQVYVTSRSSSKSPRLRCFWTVLVNIFWLELRIYNE